MSEEEVAMEVEEVEETRGCGSCAREGDWAVWDVNGEKSSFVQVKAAG